MNTKAGHPNTTRNLLPSYRSFLDATLYQGYRRFELLRIEHRELMLDAFPITIRQAKLGTSDAGSDKETTAKSQLKDQSAEFVGYVRSVDGVEIRWLEICGYLPFVMQVAQATGGSRG